MFQKPLKTAGFLLLSSFALSACSITTDPIPESNKHFAAMDDMSYELADFKKIKIKANAKVTIHAADKQSVIIATKPEHRQYINVEVVNGELIIKHSGHHNKKHYTNIIIHVVNPKQVYFDSAIEAHIDNIDAHNFDLIQDGVGAIEIKGNCINASFNFDGIGDLDASQFFCKNVDAHIEGIGSVDIYASETLSIRSRGIGDVSVHGAPELKHVDIRGIGTTNID